MTTTPSPSAKLEALQAMIVLANPAGNWRECECDRCSICMGKNNRRPVRLADVLLAAQRHIGWIEPDGMDTLWFCDQVKRWGKPMRDERIVGWNLRQDSLDQQSEETIAFLHSLLCQ